VADPTRRKTLNRKSLGGLMEKRGVKHAGIGSWIAWKRREKKDSRVREGWERLKPDERSLSKSKGRPSRRRGAIWNSH